MKKEATEVGAAIIRQGRKVLLARRKVGNLAGLWEFPGGKIESGESHGQCLIREIREEFNVEILPGDFVATSLHESNGEIIILHGYEARHLRGKFQVLEHECIEWVYISELLNWQLAPADIPIAKELIERERARG